MNLLDLQLHTMCTDICGSLYGPPCSAKFWVAQSLPSRFSKMRKTVRLLSVPLNTLQQTSLLYSTICTNLPSNQLPDSFQILIFPMPLEVLWQANGSRAVDQCVLCIYARHVVQQGSFALPIPFVLGQQTVTGGHQLLVRSRLWSELLIEVG